MIKFFSLFFTVFLVTMLISCASEDKPVQAETSKEINSSTMPLKSETSIDSTIQKRTDTVKKINPTPILISTPADADFSLNYIMGKFDPAKNSNFTKITKTHASREGMYLRKDVYNAFKKMHDAAKKEGLHFTIRSATRPFKDQKRIWEAKWTGQRKIENGKDATKAFPNPKERALKILKYSSMPGTSRHHWGTDIDLNNFENSYFEKGRGLKEYNWLLKHAASYGFCQPYTPKDAQRPHGYNEEKWHWSYIPIAKQLTDKAKKVLKNELIEGFKGAETAKEIGVVEKYVLGINSECL